MFTKFASRLLIFTLAICFGLILFVSPKADAAEACGTYEDRYGTCWDMDRWTDVHNLQFELAEVDGELEECLEHDAYLMDVIGNYQDALAYEKTQVELWHNAHDRVAENAVKRNYEYAAALEANRKLTDKVNWKNAKLRELRGIIRDLRSK